MFLVVTGGLVIPNMETLHGAGQLSGELGKVIGFLKSFECFFQRPR